MYELLVKSGLVIDPAQGIHDQRDIGISQGKIVALASDIVPSEAKRVIDAKGKIVTPGLIDIHTHVADGIIFFASMFFANAAGSSAYNERTAPPT